MNSCCSYLLFVFLLFLNTTAITAQDIEALLADKLPNATIKRLSKKKPFKDVFEIKLRQPLDHNNEAAGFFEQRLFLSHKDFDRPMLYVTEGYDARNRVYELANILNSNQLIVEYRFYGASAPETIDWSYLTNDQAMEDLHRIRKLFKKMYKKAWVSTGISKGGTTTLIYKSKYPKDVKVAIPYVAPLALAQEDKRTDEHILTVGEEACRAKLDLFQKEVLKRRTEMLTMLEAFVKRKKLVFSMELGDVLEYAVLEYTFSFWQWGNNCAAVPDSTASTQQLFNHLNNVVSYDFYSDATYEYFKPAFYQFMTELGYYGFVKSHVEDLLVTEKNANNLRFGPENTVMTFQPYLQEVVDFLDKKGNKVLYIYGALDPWTACGYTPTSKVDALRVDKKDGSHRTRISSFSKEEKELIYAKLEQWLKLEIE